MSLVESKFPPRGVLGELGRGCKLHAFHTWSGPCVSHRASWLQGQLSEDKTVKHLSFWDNSPSASPLISNTDFHLVWNPMTLEKQRCP